MVARTNYYFTKLQILIYLHNSIKCIRTGLHTEAFFSTVQYTTDEMVKLAQGFYAISIIVNIYVY